jgi:hypothetical protein
MSHTNIDSDSLALDGQNLLGAQEFTEVTPGGNGAGQNGILSLDCYCVPPKSSKYASSSGSYQAGSLAPTYQLFRGNDSSGLPYGGMVMRENYTPTGQVFEQYWFLREGETGLHTFSRLTYYNKTTPFLRNLQELRTLFRPTGDLWTHISTNDQYVGSSLYETPIAHTPTESTHRYHRHKLLPPVKQFKTPHGSWATTPFHTPSNLASTLPSTPSRTRMVLTRSMDHSVTALQAMITRHMELGLS